MLGAQDCGVITNDIQSLISRLLGLLRRKNKFEKKPQAGFGHKVNHQSTKDCYVIDFWLAGGTVCVRFPRVG